MAQWKPLDQMKILGTHYARVDGPDKVSGRAKYTYDMLPEGCLFGLMLSCPHAAAEIDKIDTRKAEAVPGVVSIVTDVHPTGTVQYAGTPVAAVAATSIEAARDAIDLIRVKYTKKRAAVDIDAAMHEDAPQIIRRRNNVQRPRRNGEGSDEDLDNAFAGSDAVVEATYRTQVQTHSCLETHGSVVAWDGDNVTIWDSTQGVHQVRSIAARFLQVNEANVRVDCQYMGGGFGSKLQPGTYTVVAARMARETGKPVKIMLTREQESMIAGNRPDSIQECRLGAMKDGTLTAFAAETYATGGPRPGGGDVAHPYVYELGVWRHLHREVVTNAGPARAFRAPGRPQACFAMEGILDEMAYELGMDPLEIRLKNDPNETRQKEWRIGAERIGWDRRKQVAGSGKGHIQTGLGCAASVWAVPGRGTEAQMTIFPDGSVEMKCGTQDIGTGTRTIVAAITAEELGLRVADVKALIGDSDYPMSVGSGGSMTMPSVAPAIKNTAEKGRAALIELAAKHFKVSTNDIVLADRKAAVKNDSSKSLDWKRLCSLLGNTPQTYHGEWVQGLSSVGVAGCQFVEVEVDRLTGRIRVPKVVAIADCGLVLDRLTTESQVNGGIIQGLSWALYEDRVMCPDSGLQINPGFETYKIAGSLEIPEIDIVIYDEAERGVMGIGEPTIIPTAAAIANAVYNATGVRMRTLPMTPDRVLTALEA